MAESPDQPSCGSNVLSKFNKCYYDGNIRNQYCKSSVDGIQRAYEYTYDGASRLNTATYASTKAGENYALNGVSYDKNGNITALNRNGATTANYSSFGNVDNLPYTYQSNSNKVLKITDAITRNTDLGDFRDNTDNDYDYWIDGSLKKDKNKKIDSNGEVTDYEEDDIYVNNNLYQSSHQEGRIANGIYEYNITDHLGNVRVSFRDSSGIAVPLQSIFYDPWGLTMKGMQVTRNLVNFNKHQFLNQETQFETGYIDLIHRQFDPQTGRFTSIDPLAEKMPSYSPFSFSFNNPVRFIDPDGRAPVPIDDYFNKEGKYLGSDNAKTDNVRVIEQNTWDTNKTINENGKETIDNQLGNQISQKFSKAKLDTKSALNVYQHYNSTDLTLKAVENKYPDGRLAGGMGFTAKNSGGKLISKYMEVSVQGNYQKDISDHANEITNTFVHEGQHYKDFKTLGVSKFMSTSVPLLEQRAILTQMNHPSFLGTRPYYQKVTDAYGKQFNYDPTKPIPPLK